MATRTVTTLVDDLDGSAAEENISFGLDRVDYEIDLSSDHAKTLREVLAPYVSAARRTGGRRATRAAQPARPATSSAAGGASRSRTTNTQIRVWASEHGVTLAERGRIPGRVIEAYEAGDPSLLPHTGSDTTTTAATTAQAPRSASGPADTNGTGASTAPASSADDSPRGRDGLTATEREAVRAWALEQGIDVKTRGQLKKDLVANYQAWQARQR